MVKKLLQSKLFIIIPVLSILFLSGCAYHHVCPNALKKECAFCRGTGVHEYQTDLTGKNFSIMKCHVCKGEGSVCLKFKDPVEKQISVSAIQ